MDHQTHQVLSFDEIELEEIKKQIEGWKDKYGSIYMTEFEDESTFIWRALSKREFDKATEYYEDIYDRAEYVCRLCVLDPPVSEIDYGNDMIAGIPEVLTENILKQSGFAGNGETVSSLVAKYEAEMTTFDNQIACIVVEAFHNLDIETVESWPLEKMLWHYSRAKWILETLRGIELVREEGPQGNVAPDGTVVKGDPRDFPELL